VGDVADLNERALVSMLGPASGRHLHALAHNRDPRPVQVGRRRRSVGSQRALGRHRLSLAELEATLAGLVDRVTSRLRAGHRLCRTVVLRMRFDDFTRATRSHTFPAPTDNTATILAAAQTVLVSVRPLIAEAGLTLIGIPRRISTMPTRSSWSFPSARPCSPTSTTPWTGFATALAQPHSPGRPWSAAIPASRSRSYPISNSRHDAGIGELRESSLMM
jgi:Nucleotidyltransferase/DNA polymerase involved in DNA repair